MLQKRLLDSLIRFKIKLKQKEAAANWNLSDIYLASYPKSGVTWLCLILANILAELKGDRRRIDMLSVHDYVPDLHSNPCFIGKLQLAQQFIKTHESFSEWRSRIELRANGVYAPRVIYLLRDGRNTISSFYYYLKALGQTTLNLSDFIDSSELRSGGWHNHASDWILDNSWLDRRSLLVVRYEDLEKDAVVELNRVLEFSGLSVGEELIERAVKAANSARIREFEDKYGDGVRYLDNSYKFAGKEERNRLRQESKEILASYYQRHQQLFSRLGYA